MAKISLRQLIKEELRNALNEVKFTKKEIIDSVTFLNGDTYTVGERSNYDGMRVTAITPIPENEREGDEAVTIEMKDGDKSRYFDFNTQGEESY